MIVQSWVIATVFLLLSALSSAAQTAAPLPPSAPADPSISAVVQELEVVGRPPGPALWKVQRGAATVVILGAVVPLPHMLNWDTVRVERALNGADLVLLPPQGRVGLFDAVNILFHAGDAHLPHGQSLYDVIPSGDRARFDNLRLQAKTDLKRYASLKPALAGVLLLSDFRKAAGLSEAKPASTIEKLARAHNVDVKTVGRLKLPALYHAVTHMTPDQDRRCLEAALSDTEREAQHGQAVAKAWADGDLNTVRALYRGALIDECVLAVPSLQAALDRGINDGVAAVNTVLSKPGKALVVVDLSLLLRPNGMLDQLRAEGASVSTPMN